VAKSWTDQPDACEHAEVLCTFSITRKGDMHQVEVRHNNGDFYLTFGNLFGSQTIRAQDGMAAFRVIRVAGISNKLPDGCVLMSPGTKAE
jgi:hypothetical protein